MQIYGLATQPYFSTHETTIINIVYTVFVQFMDGWVISRGWSRKEMCCLLQLDTSKEEQIYAVE